MKYSFTEFSPNVSDTTVVRGTKCRQIVYYTPVIKTRLINNCFALLVLSIKQTLASAKLCEATQTLNIQQRHQLITEMSGGIKKKKKKLTEQMRTTSLKTARQICLLRFDSQTEPRVWSHKSRLSFVERVTRFSLKL